MGMVCIIFQIQRYLESFRDRYPETPPSYSCSCVLDGLEAGAVVHDFWGCIEDITGPYTMLSNVVPRVVSQPLLRPVWAGLRVPMSLLNQSDECLSTGVQDSSIRLCRFKPRRSATGYIWCAGTLLLTNMTCSRFDYERWHSCRG